MKSEIEPRLCCDCKINEAPTKFIRCKECQLIKTLQLPVNFFEVETGLSLIAKERLIVQSEPNRGEANDLWLYPKKELAKAAKCMLYFSKEPTWLDALNPLRWHKLTWHKMITATYKRRLVIAGQLICAELDRIITIEKPQ